jgi:hypothetical protein
MCSAQWLQQALLVHPCRYNLDSRLPQPQLIDSEGLGDEAAVRHFLSQQVLHQDAKVFLVKQQPQAAMGAEAGESAALDKGVDAAKEQPQAVDAQETVGAF